MEPDKENSLPRVSIRCSLNPLSKMNSEQIHVSPNSKILNKNNASDENLFNENEKHNLSIRNSISQKNKNHFGDFDPTE